MKHLTKKCIVCSKEIAKNSKKFCSRDCFNKSQDKRIEKNCVYCGKKFKTKRSYVGKYCSKDCCWKNKIGKPHNSYTKFEKGLIPWNKGKTNRIQKACGFCSKEFSVVLSRKTALYCSYKCRGKAQTADNPWKECLVCKTKFQKQRKDNIKRWKERKVCSRQCQYKIQGLKGEKNHRWRGGISPLNVQIRGLTEYRQWFRAIFIRDNWTCQLCEVRSGNGKKVILNADHIKPFSKIIKEHKIDTVEKAKACKELWDTENGRTLCEDCHKRITAKQRKHL